MNQSEEIINLKQKLIEICECFINENRISTNVVVKAPYIPLIPDNWIQNQILVLFEAQNLSGSTTRNSSFIKDLDSLDFRNQITRLYGGKLDNKRIGISPWDDGYLDFPLKVCFPHFHKTDYAVGNSVFWSISANKKNLNPSKELIDKSSELWKLFLHEMKPEIIICVGNIASKVISKSGVGNAMTINTYFPYGRYANFITKHFDFSNDTDKFPEVNLALNILGKNLLSPISEYNETKIKSTLPMAISILTKLKRSK